MSDNVALPQGWVSEALNQIAEINPSFDGEGLDVDTPVSFVPMKAVSEESGVIDATDVRPLSKVRRGYTNFRDGDVLFAKITPCMENGKICVARNLHNSLGFGSTEFHVVRLKESLDPDFYFYFLIQQSFRKEAERFMTGTAGQMRVPKPYLESADVPIAPLNEQRRIVAKIEELFSKLDAGVAALERAKALLKQYRQSVLKAAVTGELTRAWREAHRDTLEPADQLLKRIQAERRRTWEEVELAKLRAKGKAPADDRWKAKYKEPKAPDTEGLPELPEGWCWATLDTVGALKGGVTKDEKRQADDPRTVPYLRVANVQRGFLDLSEMKTITVSVEVVEALRLLPGDVLFTEGGDRDKLGRGWVWNGEIADCIHQNHVFRARLFSEDMLPNFVSWYSNTFGQEYFMRFGTQTTNLASINLTNLRQFPIPMPGCKEQQQIVNELERRLSVLDAIEHDLQQRFAISDQLRQSILRSAFAGQLVPQDPADEPASVLLEQIRAERVAQVVRNERRGRGRGKAS